MVKISQCSEAVAKAILTANSLPENFSLGFELIGIEGAEKQKKFFYQSIEKLPEAFTRNNIWISKIMRGEVLSEAETIKQLKRMHPFYEPDPTKPLNIWVQFIPSEIDSENKDFIPTHRLSTAILWAKRSRSILSTINKINRQEQTWFESDESKFSHFVIEQGIIKITAFYPMNVFLDEKTDTRRIRLCDNCKNFFWAKRFDPKISDSEACEDCSNLLRQRRYQNKNRELINLERRKTYYLKEGIPFCDKCVRPNTKCDCYLKERKR